ncbi:hypothetical protein HJG60_011856 [Phyllostomus discolor]|uniref:L1 transposable element RRM domain-containing protein n=1 Tax=Phyllostomus discolor TaxID=89673 RepID=A0A833ZE68_9CHIR|nr:hypothetical protein HJG60_011856 [Phyllostomus discolor]
MAQTELNTPESVFLSDQKIANLSDAQFKALVIRMLKQLVDFGHKLDEQMQTTIREMKENAQGTNSDGKKTGFQINGRDQKEERNNQTEKNEETRIQKNEERLRDLQDIFKHSNIQIIGVPEGEEENQQVEKLFEQIIKENFPNLAKELPGSPGSSESPKEFGPKEEHTKALHNIITQDKNGENFRSSKR